MHGYPLRQGSGAGLPLGLQKKKGALVSPRTIAVSSVQSIVNITGRSRLNQLTSGGRCHAAPFGRSATGNHASSQRAIWSRNSAVGSSVYFDSSPYTKHG